MANPIFLNLGIKVDDIYKNLDDNLINEIKKASADGFTTAELQSLEEDGIDVSLIEDNCTDNETTEIKDTDNEQIREAKEKLQNINKNILDKTAEIRVLEGEILLLEDEINETFLDNINKNEELEQEQKEAIAKAQKEEMAKYTSSQGEMSEDEFKDNLSSRLKGLDSEFGSKFAKIANDILDNECNKAKLAGMVSKQENLSAEVNTLKTEANTLSTQIDTLEAQALAAMQQQDDGLGFGDPPPQTKGYVGGDLNNDGVNDHKDSSIRIRKIADEMINTPESQRVWSGNKAEEGAATQLANEMTGQVPEAMCVFT